MQMKRILSIITFLILSIISLTLQQDKLRIHIIPHSHDDVGWLKTMDDYYNTQPECVKCILDNIVASLTANKERTFVYSEIAFFEKWYKTQSDEIKNKLKEFINEGRFDFVNGGWVMNDEACAATQDIIDQLRLGMDFLNKEFNYVPKIAWQLDPFGHSKTNAYVLSKLGYENLVLVRIDYKEKDIRKSNKEMEFVWKPYFSVDQGRSSIFTHITHGHYDPDLPFYYEKRAINDWELSDISNKALSSLENIAKAYKTKNIMVLYGDDFKFTDDRDFKNIEKMMNYMRSQRKYSDKLDIFYSTPKRYFEDIKNANKEWPELKDYDFFPYADKKTCYWTGYFTSRPYLKGLVRDVRKYLRYFTDFYVNYFLLKTERVNNSKADSAELRKKFLNELNSIRRVLAIAQHHDAVSGTAREAVSEDYIQMLNTAKSNLVKTVKDIMLGQNNNNKSLNICIPSAADFDCYDYEYSFSGTENEKQFIFINIEINKNEKSSIRSTFPVTLKFDTADFEIFKSNGEKENNYDVFCSIDKDIKTTCYATLLLKFLPDFSYLHYTFKHLPEISKLQVESFIKNNKNLSLDTVISKLHITIPRNFQSSSSYLNVWENNNVKISFSPQNGFKYISKNDSNKEYNFMIKYATYKTNEYSDLRNYNSCTTGAYMLAPTTLIPVYENLNLKESFYVDGPLSFQIYLKFDWSTLKLTIYKDDKFDFMIESKSIMFPIQSQNREYLFVLESSDLDNTSTEYNNIEFFTDTNDSLMIQRIKDYRFSWKLKKDEALADNFYPINSSISIRDKNKNYPKKISVWNDRSQAGTSLEKGKIYLTMNRISNRDDYRGLADGVYEKRNSWHDYHFTHFITLGDKFDKKFLNDYIKTNTMVIETNDGETILKNIPLRPQSLILQNEIDKDCFLVDLYVIDEFKFLLQVTNKFNDPYFNDGQMQTCTFILNENVLNSDYMIKEVKLNGIEDVPSRFKFQNMRFRRDNRLKVTDKGLIPYDITTFLIEKLNKN